MLQNSKNQKLITEFDSRGTIIKKTCLVTSNSPGRGPFFYKNRSVITKNKLFLL